jgi:tRNA(adenine34) deaminase
MHEALKEAKLAYLEQEVPVGAVIVKNGAIVSRAHNRCVADHDPTAHAEMLSMSDAYQKLGSLEDCTLYVTLEPCAMCTGAMIHLRLRHLVFGAFDAACGCCGSRIDLSDHWFEHSVDAIGGVCESECTELLIDFFQNLRNE